MSAVSARVPLMNLRPMAEADLSAILPIESTAYSFPWTRNIFKGCLRDGYCCRVLELDGVIAGYAVMSMQKDEAHLLNLCIDPGRHRNGLGGILLKFMLDFAQKQEAVTTFLEVRPSNKVARRFYEKGGFVEVGLERDYYPAVFGREDAIIMAQQTP